MRNKFYARAWSILRPLVMFFLPVELRGTENLGDEAAILCANHSSAWDPILLVLAMPQNFTCSIMAEKAAVFHPRGDVGSAEHRRVPRGSRQQ